MQLLKFYNVMSANTHRYEYFSSAPMIYQTEPAAEGAALRRLIWIRLTH